MSEARFIVGDVFEEMAKMPDNSVECLITSPPFLALRSYLPSDHPDKAKEIGSEPTPAAFLTTLLALTREWRRILTPTGSLCVELGDTYSGAGGYGSPDSPNPAYGAERFDERWTGRTGKRFKTKDDRWPEQKSLCLIPSLYAGSLAYGRNLLNPDDVLEPWRVRNLIVWHRPNPPVGALGDKVRPSTSYVTVACTAKDRWFDLDSERTPAQQPEVAGDRSDRRSRVALAADGKGDPAHHGAHPAGAPPLDCWFEERLAQSDESTDLPEQDVWTIPTAPYAGSHYATFPPALPRRLINLMCPRQVCVSCGEPRRRIVDNPNAGHGANMWNRHGTAAAVFHKDVDRPHESERTTLGWTDCGCFVGFESNAVQSVKSQYRRGIVLDPFAGSGTTLQAASELGRDSIGIDLDRRNLELARQRLGMFLVEEDEVPA